MCHRLKTHSLLFHHRIGLYRCVHSLIWQLVIHVARNNKTCYPKKFLHSGVEDQVEEYKKDHLICRNVIHCRRTTSSNHSQPSTNHMSFFSIPPSGSRRRSVTMVNSATFTMKRFKLICIRKRGE